MLRLLRSVIRMNLLAMKLWGRKKKFTLFLLSHLRLQKVQAHSVISALVKMEKALHLYSKRFWEEEGDTTLTSLFFQYRIVILFYFVIVKSPSRVRLFATPWTVAYQAPPSMGFSRQQYWSGLPFPSPNEYIIYVQLPGSHLEWLYRLAFHQQCMKVLVSPVVSWSKECVIPFNFHQSDK